MTVKTNTRTQPDATDAPKPGPAGAPGTGTPSGTPEEQQAAQQQAQDDAQQAAAAAAAAEGAEDADGNDSDGGNKAGREAARYRRQLRDVETERDQLAGTIDKLQRGIITQNMPRWSKLNADALIQAGYTTAEMFTDDGMIDTDKLKAAAQATHEKFGITDIGVVRRSGERSEELYRATTPTWGEALKGGK